MKKNQLTKAFLLTLSMLSINGPVALGQTSQSQNQITAQLRNLEVPTNNHLVTNRQRLSPLNLDFSQCNPAPGTQCEPGSFWFRDTLNLFNVTWYPHGFQTPGAAVIQSTPMAFNTPNRFGAFGQCISATNARGHSITVLGWVAAVNVNYGYAGLWLRIDDAFGNTISLDNMYGRGLSGQTGYVQLVVGAYLPANASKICLGGLLTGAGTAFFDDFMIYYN